MYNSNSDISIHNPEVDRDPSVVYGGEYGFRYRKVESKMSQEEQLSHIVTVAYNAIFFQLDGELLINWGEHKDVEIKAGDMYFLPRGANVSACIVGDSISYLVVRLEHNIYRSKGFGILAKIKEQRRLGEYHFKPLEMNGTMLRFCDSVKDYLLREVQSPHLYSIKLSELWIILRWCYSVMDNAHMLYPIVGFNSDFEQFVLDNYRPTSNVEELVAKSNMSRSTFDRKFKEAFQTTPLKWIESQTRRAIVQKSTEPNVTVKDIMYEVGIYNPSQFTQLCRRLLGMTPSELIRSR